MAQTAAQAPVSTITASSTGESIEGGATAAYLRSREWEQFSPTDESFKAIMGSVNGC